MPDFSEERLSELIAVLSPAPGGWVQAAIELPRATVALDELTARAMEDQGFRHAILADLEEALHTAGVEPRPKLLETLRARLNRPD